MIIINFGKKNLMIYVYIIILFLFFSNRRTDV